MQEVGSLQPSASLKQVVSIFFLVLLFAQKRPQAVSHVQPHGLLEKGEQTVRFHVQLGQDFACCVEPRAQCLQ